MAILFAILPIPLVTFSILPDELSKATSFAILIATLINSIFVPFHTLLLAIVLELSFKMRFLCDENALFLHSGVLYRASEDICVIGDYLNLWIFDEFLHIKIWIQRLIHEHKLIQLFRNLSDIKKWLVKYRGLPLSIDLNLLDLEVMKDDVWILLVRRRKRVSGIGLIFFITWRFPLFDILIIQIIL